MSKKLAGKQLKVMACPVSKTEFYKVLDLYAYGEITEQEAARRVMMHEQTFRKRAGQIMAPDVFGEVPPEFFDGTGRKGKFVREAEERAAAETKEEYIGEVDHVVAKTPQVRNLPIL